MAKKKSTEKTAADVLTTPAKHAEVTKGVAPTTDVASPDVPQSVEVGARSADMDAASTTHEKDFVLGPNPVDNTSNPYTTARGFDHEPNLLATRQYAIDNGLWPTGDASFKSAKRHSDGESWILTYVVPVIPAHDAVDGSQTPSVSRVASPEIDDDGEPTGKMHVEDHRNYAPPSEATEPTE